MSVLKNSVGVWAFGPGVRGHEPMTEKTRRVCVQTLELAQTLQDVGYGEQGEIVGFDLYPYTEDQVEAVRRAIVQWEFIWDLAAKIEREELREAKSRADALLGQRALYRALGLDEDYEAEIVRRRKEARAARSEV